MRQFVDVAASFPEECGYVLEALGMVYGNDALAREQGLDAEQRLRFHQQYSAPLMDQLHGWLQEQLSEAKTEPNSGLGKAISYLLNHLQPLTLFLREKGAPLDNNLCERALKKAILNRKNAMFYKTSNGAIVGDLSMSLIHTCELNGVNSFHYLTELQRHSSDMKRTPADWMPWNYGDSGPDEIPGRGVILWFGAWPKRIDCGHAWVTLPNARQTGLSKGKIQ